MNTPDAAEIAALVKAPNGQITVEGYDQQKYHFRYGWLARLELEKIYDGDLSRFGAETDYGVTVSNVLLAGLRTVKANNLPADFSREQLYATLDNIGEDKVKQVYEIGMHALGFIMRILDVSEEDVKRLAEAAVSAPPTGEES